MRWDIDKALASISVSKDMWPVIHRALSTHKTGEESREAGLGLVWCLEVGYGDKPRLKSYGKTIREAYLRLRRKIKALPVSEQLTYGVQYPKRSNSYAAARRKKGSRKSS